MKPSTDTSCDRMATGWRSVHLPSRSWQSRESRFRSGTHCDLSKAQQAPNEPNEPLSTWMRRPANHPRLKVEEYKAYENLIPALKSKLAPICLEKWAYSGGRPNRTK